MFTNSGKFIATSSSLMDSDFIFDFQFKPHFNKLFSQKFTANSTAVPKTCLGGIVTNIMLKILMI